MLGRVLGFARQKAGCVALATFFLAAFALLPDVALARGPLVGAGNSTEIAVAQLPAEGRVTYRLIQQGGPFPYDKDGSVFGNRERLLPPERRGFYREYTVRTPGVRHRGAVRIVCGGPVRAPEACYYTSDHYASFRRLVEIGN